ncbi:probable Maltose permease [Fusarium torulosum]|uniref:Probable Maltose permease n=1 Tax=Fusarium torulosum TaxID=33205 RepID=A0AAE8SKQ7_9HYPO|nr:probable Maltose permease [Fusarium torulosum]
MRPRWWNSTPPTKMGPSHQAIPTDARPIPLPELPEFATGSGSPRSSDPELESLPNGLIHELWLPQSHASDSTTRRVYRGFADEKEATFFACCRQYPKAVGWSLLLFLTVVMEAYDKSLVTGLFAFPAFRRKYGEPTMPRGTPADEQMYEISPSWQMGLQNAAIVCEIIGLLAHGYITDLIGYRKMMLVSLFWMCIAVFPAFFAGSIGVLLTSQALSGLSWGVIEILAATYAAEVVPNALRPFVLSSINMCWLVGQVIGTGILRSLVHETSQWSYRLPFALQWAWAIPLLFGVWFAPDSPWWLIRHERIEDAKRALTRLSNKNNTDIEDTISLMKHTNKMEKDSNYGGANYKDLFTGVNRRRTEIACVAWMCQAFSGWSLTSYAPYFFEQAGFSASISFNLSTACYGVGIIGGIISWTLLPFVGRRKLYIYGLIAPICLLTAGGVVWVVLNDRAGANWTLAGLIVAMTFVYDMTIGPVCYIVVAEIPSTRLRVKTVALARVTYNLCLIFNNVIMPKMLNPSAWDIGGASCFLYAGTSFFCLIWCYIRLPETRNLTYLELDILFDRKAATPKFKELQDRLEDSAYLSMTRAERLTNWHGWLAYS